MEIIPVTASEDEAKLRRLRDRVDAAEDSQSQIEEVIFPEKSSMPT
jgi:hypothetical protein